MKERPILFSGAMVKAILDGRKTVTRRRMKLQPDDDAVIDIGEIGTSTGVAYIGNSTSGGLRTRVPCPYGQPGDLLWVREAWQVGHDVDGRGKEFSLLCPTGSTDRDGRVFYRADPMNDVPRWRSPIHMPRWASRLTLRITGVRVERLQDISEADSLAEGCRAVEAEPWWQGYKECEGELMHQQARGRVPPDWMIEPKPSYNPTFDPLACTAKQAYESLWNSINGKGSWDANPWVWVIEFERIEQQARVA